MAALTKDRNTQAAAGAIQSYPVLAAVTCYAGAIAALDEDGWVKPGVEGTNLVCVGRFNDRVDNSAGANGALNATVQPGQFWFANSAAADEITKADIGDDCFIADDQTVAKTDNGKARSVAGRVVQVDASLGVLVEMGTGVPAKLGIPTITVGAEAANSINVAIQLKDGSGQDLAERASVLAYLSDDANGDSIAATAPDGNVAIGTDGVLIPVVADKAFHLVSEADGDIDLDIGESGVDTFYLIIVMPDGRLVASEAITFA